MNSLANAIGEICKIMLPIPEEIFYGNQNSSVAICTLSNISLLKELSQSEIMHNVAIVGRLLSENKGIDSLVNSVIQNPNISTIILCGKDVWGHKTGHSLIALHQNGITSDGRIINSLSPDPMLTISIESVEKFQKQIRVIDKIGETNYQEIIKSVDSL